MSDINNVILTGHLGANPEVKYFESGAILTKCSIAVNSYNSKEKKEVPTWIHLRIWGKTAEFVSEYAKQGDFLCVSGSLCVDKYTDANGNDKTFTYVKVNEVINPNKKGAERD